jgi:hypothetical protein
MVKHGVHRWFPSAHVGFVNNIIMDQGKIVQQLKGKGAGIEMRCSFSAEPKVADYKKNRPNAFAIPENKVLDITEQYGRKFAEQELPIKSGDKLFKAFINPAFYLSYQRLCI